MNAFIKVRQFFFRRGEGKRGLNHVSDPTYCRWWRCLWWQLDVLEPECEGEGGLPWQLLLLLLNGSIRIGVTNWSTSFGLILNKIFLETKQLMVMFSPVGCPVIVCYLTVHAQQLVLATSPFQNALAHFAVRSWLCKRLSPLPLTLSQQSRDVIAFES